MIFDVDGVFTNSTLLITEEGNELRTFNIKDGFAIAQAVKAEIAIFIISGGRSQGVVKRLQKLGIVNIYMEVENKSELLSSLAKTGVINLEHTLYAGDDIPDIKAMQHCLISACPADAAIEVLETAKYISAFKGGDGFVRDVVKKVLLANVQL